MKKVAIVQRPNFKSLTGGYCRFWHKVVIPARQPLYPGRTVRKHDNPMPESTVSPQSGTKNLAAGQILMLMLVYARVTSVSGGR
jgi:hypothetical protein